MQNQQKKYIYNISNNQGAFMCRVIAKNEICALRQARKKFAVTKSDKLFANFVGSTNETAAQ